MLSPTEEHTLIRAAKVGDSTAKLALITAYEPMTKSLARPYRQIVDADDATSAIALGVLTAIAEVDDAGIPAFAGFVRRFVNKELKANAQLLNTVNIPPHTMHRFMSILKTADNSYEMGAQLASSMDMAEQTFRTIYLSLYAAALEDTDQLAPDCLASTEDTILVQIALGAMTELQRKVVTIRYGLDAYSETTLLEAGEQLQLTRSVVYRHHAMALQAARQRLGVLPA